MSPTIIVAGAAIAVAVWLWARKSSASEPAPPATRDDPPPKRDDDKPPIGLVVQLPPPNPGFRWLIPPKPPGSTPGTAITRDVMPPGYDGYVRVTPGDTMIKIAAAASPLDGPPIPWRALRDDPENLWAKLGTPQAQWEQYGILLNPVWGKTVGVDCELTPGWRARRHNSYTGTFPVLRVRQVK